MVFIKTDRFVFHTRTDEISIHTFIYKGLQEIKDEMDFSGYDQKHKCVDASIKEVLGKFKCESDGQIITGLIGLCPKCYALKFMVMIKNKRHVKAQPRIQ